MKDKDIYVLILLTCGVLGIIGLVCAFPSISLHLMDAHILSTDISEYNPCISSMSLCRYFSVREEDTIHASAWFPDQYQRKGAFFRYEEYYNGGYEHETAILALSYENGVYSSAFEDISNQPGFSDEIVFNYGDFEFRLNDAERICNKSQGINHCLTDFRLVGDSLYLHWINLVGWSASRREIAFVGFYHVQKWRSGFWSFEETYYPFVSWNALFENELPYYNWSL